MLDIVSDEATLRQTREFSPLRPGVCLSEALVGSGTVGTALVEAKYVEVIGPEHFVSALHEFTCQAVPVRGPDDFVVGVVGIAVKRVEALDRVREILFCAAHGIEAELGRTRVQKDVARVLADRGATASVDKLWQDMTQLPSAARLTVEMAAKVVGAKVVEKERPRDAFRLILTADTLIMRFARQADLWREMAYDDCGSPQPIDLTRRITEIAELLATEAAVRGVTVDVQSAPDFRVTADVRALSRTILRTLLRALENSPSGSTLAIRTDRDRHGARVLFSTGDALVLAHEAGSEQL